jgi:hypothetical protein
MKKYEKDLPMSHKIVLIGAGSANFGLGVMGDLLRSQVFAGSTICLHDINAEALARTEAFGRRHIEAHNLPFTLTATTDRKTALTGADFCIISIEVGNRFELWEQDWQHTAAVRHPPGLRRERRAGRLVPRPAHHPADPRHLRRHHGDLPGRLGAQLQQPDEPHLHHGEPPIPRPEAGRHLP